MKLILPARTDHLVDSLRFCAQLGADGIMSGPGPDDTPNGYYEMNWLVDLVSSAEQFGLSVESLSLLPWHLCYKWMLGLPGRDEQIENALTSIRHMGAAGVPVMVFNMHGLRFYRTTRIHPERAGATATAFDYAKVKDAPVMSLGPAADPARVPPEQRRPLTDDDMWANYTYFIKAAAPVAEEAGVKLALHPDDPQVPVIAGVARIMRSPEAFRRALEIADSPALGLKYCTGCFSQMGADVEKEIRYFGGLGKIYLVDFRNIRGTVGDFHETFLDNGQEDMLALMCALKQSGFEGPIEPDHAAHITGDADSRQYWSYAAGYMRALMQAAERYC